VPVHLFEASELEQVEDRPGVYRTPDVAPADLPARSVVASWNHATTPATPLRVRVQVRRRGEWSPWLPVAVRGAAAEESPPEYPEGLRLAGDEVVSDGPTLEAARVEVEVGEGEPAPRRVGASFWPRFAPVALPDDPVEPEVTVDRLAQYHQDTDETHRICGPCSLTMALRHFGQEAEVLEVMAAVRDPWAGIYGNWSYLAAYAGERGLAAWVERGGGPPRLGQVLEAGRLAILSLSWRDHELPGAPNPSSDGHLVLAVGAEEGGVVVLDPAFRDQEVQAVTYPWQGLLRAWKSGAMVVVGRDELFSPGA
jgi:hypothetical protein